MNLFDNALMTVNLIGLLEVWGQLVECYHGKNGYGGDVAEIYAYHLTRYSPLVHDKTITGKRHEEAKAENALHAANALCSIIEEFCNKYECRAEIDCVTLAEWCALCNHGRHVYDHRCHVKILKQQPAAAAHA